MSEGRFHWSNCAPPAKFFKINATASVPWLVLLLHPSWWGLYTAVGVTVVLVYIEVVKKMTVLAFVRSIGVALTGRVKATVNLLKEFAR